MTDQVLRRLHKNRELLATVKLKKFELLQVYIVCAQEQALVDHYARQGQRGNMICPKSV